MPKHFQGANEEEREQEEQVHEGQAYEEKIKALSCDESSIKKELGWLDEDIEHLGKFYVEFGSKHPENPVTALADDFNDDLWSKHNDLEDQLYEVQEELDKCRRKLSLIEDNAKKNNCQCLEFDK